MTVFVGGGGVFGEASQSAEVVEGFGDGVVGFEGVSLVLDEDGELDERADVRVVHEPDEGAKGDGHPLGDGLEG